MWILRKIHSYKGSTRENFTVGSKKVAWCGYSEEEYSGISFIVNNPMHVTCEKCIKIIAPMIREKFNV